MILSERSATRDQVRGGHFRDHALAQRRPALARTRLFLPDEIAAFVAGREREAEREHGDEGGYSCGTGPRACAAASALLFEGHTTRHRPLDQSRTCRTYKSPLRGS